MMRVFCQFFTGDSVAARLPGPGKLGAVTAVEEVNEQADDETISKLQADVLLSS